MKQNQYGWRAGMALALTALLAGCGIWQCKEEGTSSSVASADGSEIRYGVRGHGDITVVFVHCWTCNHAFWNAQVEHFAKSYRVAWLDLAGHGTSGSRRHRFTMEAFGTDVAAVVDRIGADRVVLVGHSMGGPVAVEAAKQLGDKVIGIVGVDTFYTPFEYPASEAKIAEFAKPFEEDFAGASEKMVRSMFTPQADPETVEWILGEMSGASPEMGISAMYEIFRWSAANAPATLERYADELRNINGAPTGSEKALHESVTLVPGVGHFVAQVKPKEFNAVLTRIIEEELAK